MLPGPVFAFDLVTSARRRRVHVVRVVYGALLLATIWLYQPWFVQPFAVTTMKQAADAMAFFFAVFATVQILAVLVVCPAVVAGSIARERERRTIEYLLAAPLGNSEIVLGKLGAGLFKTVYVLLVGQPMLALATLMGGIPPDRQLLVLLLTVSTLAAVAGLSIFVSVWSARVRTAVGRTYGLLFLLLFVPWFIEMLITVLSMSSAGVPSPLLRPVRLGNAVLVGVSPFSGLLAALSPTAGGTAAYDALGRMATIHFAFSAICVAVAVGRMRRTHLRAAGTPSRSSRTALRRSRRGLAQKPMLWKELYVEPGILAGSRLGRMLMGLALVGGAMLMAIGFVKTLVASFDDRDEAVMLYGALVGTCTAILGLIWIAARAAVSIAAERERETWGTLLATPLTAREIISAKVLGSLYASRWIGVLLAALWIATAIVSPVYLGTVVFLVGTTALLGVFAAALGVRISLTAKGSISALVGTFGTGLVLGGGYLFCGIPCFSAVAFSGTGRDEVLILMMAPCIPFLLWAPWMLSEVGTGTDSAGLMVSYIVGCGGYFVAALLLYESAVQRFDLLASRMKTEHATIPQPIELTAAPQNTPRGE